MSTVLAKNPAKTRPGLKMGLANEYFLMTPITPEGAKRLRKVLADGWTGDRQKATDRIGTVHDLRMVLIDNDTRVIFTSTYDGDWDSYMNDFATIIPEELDYVFSDFAGYPGAQSRLQGLAQQEPSRGNRFLQRVSRCVGPGHLEGVENQEGTGCLARHGIELTNVIMLRTESGDTSE
jgi:hypothetical protein